MAQQFIGFKTVQLLKDQTLGIGSYGKVCKAKCDGLLCAAKLIHETLFDPWPIAPQREHRLPMRRFEQECEFMSTIRHPNIVQYLGSYRDPDTGLPALLMELMDDSLTHFLESSLQPIPYHIQVNVCHDITLALSFLHSSGIIHRDLSSNNVLLIGNVRAKVTDFGMARLGDMNPQVTRLTFTVCPGTDVYMPPEAVQDRPVYTEKIDCFSFGVIIVQTITRQFPEPGDRRKMIQMNQLGLPPIVEVRVSEIERRQNHINEIDPNHTLLQVALDCLKDRDIERPSAQQLCERVTALKEDPQYSESVRLVEARSTAEQDRSDERERVLRQQHSQQVQSLQQIIQEKNQALREKDEALTELEQEKNTVIVYKEGELLKPDFSTAVTQNESEKCTYLASLLCKEIKHCGTRCIMEIYIVITGNLDAHRNIMITDSRFKDAQVKTDQLIVFESDQIKFNFSNISNKNWEIKCLNSPVVKRKDVDNFIPGETSWVPYAMFKAKFSDNLTPPCDLECVVKIIGAEQPHNKFDIDISPQGYFTSQQQPHQPQALSGQVNQYTRLVNHPILVTSPQQPYLQPCASSGQHQDARLTELHHLSPGRLTSPYQSHPIFFTSPQQPHLQPCALPGQHQDTRRTDLHHPITSGHLTSPYQSHPTSPQQPYLNIQPCVLPGQHQCTGLTDLHHPISPGYLRVTSPYQSESHASSEQASKCTRLRMEHLISLIRQLTVHAAKWREIGTFLGFQHGELENIQYNAYRLTNPSFACLQEMLTNWCQWAPGDFRGSTNFATLEALKNALQQVGLGVAAHDLHL